MCNDILDAYGPGNGGVCPPDLQQALREKYRLELKVKNLEHAIKCGDPKDFDARMKELETASTQLAAVIRRAGDLNLRWRHERTMKDYNLPQK